MEIGGIKLEYLGHSGFMITNSGGKRIAIDPYGISDSVEKADFIFVTHCHYDHCSIKDIEKLSKEGTVVVVSPDGQSKITKIDGIKMQLIEVGDELDFSSFKVEAVPAYNIEKEFHPKREDWMGYILKFGNVVIYHAGDTDKIPEMQNLTGHGKEGNIFIALLPVSGEYVMDSLEAASAVAVIKPTIAIPMHYGAGVAGTAKDADKFAEVCAKAGFNAQILQKI